jgi:hypothetical protein
MGKLSAHFSMSKVYCHCGCGLAIVNSELISLLESAREIACIPFNITSWCRCKAYNDSLPNSVPDSAHLKGLAVDINVDSSNRNIILKSLRKAGFVRIGKAKTFLHVDIDKDKPQTEWNYK